MNSLIFVTVSDNTVNGKVATKISRVVVYPIKYYRWPMRGHPSEKRTAVHISTIILI